MSESELKLQAVCEELVAHKKRLAAFEQRYLQIMSRNLGLDYFLEELRWHDNPDTRRYADILREVLDELNDYIKKY